MNSDDQDACGHSLCTRLWDKNPDISKSQKLISDTVHESHDAKHPAIRGSEVQFLNSLPVNHCAICGFEHFISYGFYKDETRCLAAQAAVISSVFLQGQFSGLNESDLVCSVGVKQPI